MNSHIENTICEIVFLYVNVGRAWGRDKIFSVDNPSRKHRKLLKNIERSLLVGESQSAIHI